MYGKSKKWLLSLSIICSCIGYNSSYADSTMPKFDCTLTNQLTADKEAGEPQDTFARTTPEIYLICDSDDVKKGQSIKAAWIAADTKNVAPANYKIDEKSIQVPSDLASDQQFTGNFSLSKPNNGWPVGSYHVDLYVDNQLVQSVKFSVQ